MTSHQHKIYNLIFWRYRLTDCLIFYFKRLVKIVRWIVLNLVLIFLKLINNHDQIVIFMVWNFFIIMSKLISITIIGCIIGECSLYLSNCLIILINNNTSSCYTDHLYKNNSYIIIRGYFCRYPISHLRIQRAWITQVNGRISSHFITIYICILYMAKKYT
jgi:hypothetical protein